jgi:hypothetical protein
MDGKIEETVFYMKSMNEYSKQEILRYIRGVYDGSQLVKRQYGITTPTGEARSDREQPAQAGKSA